jgi:hypothetical protein
MAGKTGDKPGSGTGQRQTPPPPPHQIQFSLDGNQLLGSLTKAGLDPKKLDLAKLLGRGVSALDIRELETLLHSADAAQKAKWKASVKGTFDIHNE